MFELSVSLLFLALFLDVPLNLVIYSIFFFFSSFSSIFSYLQPFFCTLAALSRCSRYSSSTTTKKEPHRHIQSTPREGQRRSWCDLRSSWGHLGHPLGALGTMLGALRGSWDALWSSRGAFWELWGNLWDGLGVILGVFLAYV